MPLERRVRLPRSYQRERRGGIRHQPYNLTRCLHDLRSGEELQSRLPSENAQIQIPCKILAKRAGYGEFTCIPRDKPMPSNASHSNALSEDEAEEAQRLSPDQRAQSNDDHRSWHTEERKSLTFCRVTRSHNTLLPSVKTSSNSAMSGSETTNSVNLLSPMTPNAVVTAETVPIPSADLPPYEDFFESASNASCESLYDCSTDFDTDSVTALAASLCRRGSLPGMAPALATPGALQMANRVIRHARLNKTPDRHLLLCPDCHRLPVLPVTLPCGHTRCTNCIKSRGVCYCGSEAPNIFYVNTLIQDLTRKILHAEATSRSLARTAEGCANELKGARRPIQSSLHKALSSRPVRRFKRSRSERSRPSQRSSRPTTVAAPQDTLMSPQTRFEFAWRLLCAGQLREAAPHFARVAATSPALARASRVQLIQIISVISKGRDPKRLTRELYRSVRAQGASGWLRAADLECVLCYQTFINPVATPCGHNYCRTCLERSLDYRKACPLCLRSLLNFNLSDTKETKFLHSTLASIDAVSPPKAHDPDIIPIFVCTVAYPSIPCPLLILDPRYWLMIRRVLESGSRKFGMVAYERGPSDYGTVLQVCDCVHLEDGRSILSTIGLSRFRVIRRDVRDGCDVARIQPLVDIIPSDNMVVWELRLMATQILFKALIWLNNMNHTVKSEIEAAFGWMPHLDHQQQWWRSPDGPTWIWWLVAILPLRPEIKILILSTKSLMKRMMAVARTLDAIERVVVPTPVTVYDLDNPRPIDLWL